MKIRGGAAFLSENPHAITCASENDVGVVMGLNAVSGVMEVLGNVCSFRIESQMCELETEEAGVECGGGGESKSDLMAKVSVLGQLILPLYLYQ